MRTLTEHIVESKALHQNANINEKLLINKDFRIADDLDSFLDNYIEEHTDDIDEDNVHDIDDIVNIVTYNFWKPDYNLRKGYFDARQDIYNYIEKYLKTHNKKINDDELTCVYSASDMYIKELDKKFYGTAVEYIPSSGKGFYIKRIETDHFLVIRYDNSKLSYGKIVDAIVRF